MNQETRPIGLSMKYRRLFSFTAAAVEQDGLFCPPRGLKSIFSSFSEQEQSKQKCSDVLEKRRDHVSRLSWERLGIPWNHKPL